jgi:hypothetical protein
VSLGETVNESGIQVYDGSGNTYSGSNVSFTHYRSIGGGGDQNATLTTVGISNQTASSGKLTLTLDHPPPPPAACSLPVEA